MSLTEKEADESKRALYLAYLDDFARIGSRQETMRTFYVSIVTLLLGLVGLAGTDEVFAPVRRPFFVAVGCAGIVVCLAWRWHMVSFGSLFASKRKALEALERKAKFRLQPFVTEAKVQERRTHLSTIDQLVAIGFFLLFAFFLIAKAVT